MKMELYSVKDTKLGSFAQAFNAPNEAIAKRMVQSTVNAKGNQINEYPEDFQLFKLGSYDDQTGELTSDVKFILNVIDLKKNDAE